MAAHCLVVDDDADIRSSLKTYLEGFGMQVSTAADGAALRRLLATARCDVLVLDLMLPGEDGLSLLRWVQREWALPVIMLTARADPTSRVVGLEMGADDYLAKPFEPRELLARIQAVLRRLHKAQDGDDASRMVSFGRWRFDRLQRQLLTADDVGIALSGAEYRLLAAFVQRPGRVLSREQLIELTRTPGVEVNERSIDLGVSRLRAKLDDASRAAPLIRTVRGEGYLFDTEVQR